MQLHIFEVRYREMIEFCLESGVPFGVALIRSGTEVGEAAEPYLVGTKVRILESYRYADGCFDLTIEGVERFRIRQLDHDASYLRGKIEPLIEIPEVDESYLSHLCAEARSLGELLVKEHVDHREFAIKVLFPDDPEQLSFALANMVDFPSLRKQFFLELVETSVRLEAIIEVLTHLAHGSMPSMRRLTSQDLQEWVSPN